VSIHYINKNPSPILNTDHIFGTRFGSSLDPSLDVLLEPTYQTFSVLNSKILNHPNNDKQQKSSYCPISFLSFTTCSSKLVQICYHCISHRKTHQTNSECDCTFSPQIQLSYIICSVTIICHPRMQFRYVHVNPFDPVLLYTIYQFHTFFLILVSPKFMPNYGNII